MAAGSENQGYAFRGPRRDLSGGLGYSDGLPGMGVDAKVTKFESTGAGSMQIDLGHLVPTRSEMETKIDMGLEMEVVGETQTQNMAMIIAVGFSRT